MILIMSQIKRMFSVKLIKLATFKFNYLSGMLK